MQRAGLRVPHNPYPAKPAPASVHASTLPSLLAFLALVLSGCAGGGAQEGISSNSETGESTGGGGPGSTGGGASTTVTGTATEGGNRQPSLSFSASIQQGPAPLNVTFTVGGTDPDTGARLSYILKFGDGASAQNGSLPSGFSEKVTHGYAFGVYNATITVSDGVLKATSYLVINATVTLGDAVTWICRVDVDYNGPVGFSGSIGGKTVGSCLLGTTERDMALVSHEAPTGCRATAGGAEVQDATLYPTGTEFRLACDSGVNDKQGSVTLQ